MSVTLGFEEGNERLAGLQRPGHQEVQGSLFSQHHHPTEHHESLSEDLEDLSRNHKDFLGPGRALVFSCKALEVVSQTLMGEALAWCCPLQASSPH